MLSMILAIGKNGVVGNSHTNKGLPWYYPEDLEFYKNKTTNKINVIGKTTYDMIGKALPNRTTIVLSRNQDLTLPDAKVINDYHTIINDYKASEEEVMICGGVEIFELFLNDVDKIYLTLVTKDYEGDKFYHPNLANFIVSEQHQGQDPDLVFYTLTHK